MLPLEHSVQCCLYILFFDVICLFQPVKPFYTIVNSLQGICQNLHVHVGTVSYRRYLFCFISHFETLLLLKYQGSESYQVRNGCLSTFDAEALMCETVLFHELVAKSSVDRKGIKKLQ